MTSNKPRPTYVGIRIFWDEKHHLWSGRVNCHQGRRITHTLTVSRSTEAAVLASLEAQFFDAFGVEITSVRYSLQVEML